MMPPPKARIFVSTSPVDMRRGFDGLAALARDLIGHDARDAVALFVFFNRGVDRVKILWWDHNGYCVLAKRLERGRFRIPSPIHVGDAYVDIDRHELELVVAGTTLTARQLHVRG